MLSFSAQIITDLIKYYNLTHEESESIINEEWDYIEEFFYEDIASKDVAKKLVTIYMVA